MTTIADLLRNNIPAADESVIMLKNIFGDFTLDPFNSSGGSGSSPNGSLLSAMFRQYNMFIFTVAMVWFAYTFLAGLTNTMNEGVVFGQKMSSVWVPIRVVFGTVSLMPIFGGWAFCQALMMIATLLGIAGANSLSTVAIDSAGAFQTVVNPMGSSKSAAQLKGIEEAMLSGSACMLADGLLNKQAQDLNAGTLFTGSTATSFLGKVTQSGDDIVLGFPGKKGEFSCGMVRLHFSPLTNDLTDVSSYIGYRIPNVDYHAIRNLSMKAHLATLTKLLPIARTITVGAVTSATPAEFKAALAIAGADYFDQYSKIFQVEIANAAKTASDGANTAITTELLKKMKEGGWATLGTWYGVFAATNEAMNEMLDPNVEILMKTADQQSSEEIAISYGLRGIFNKAMDFIKHPVASVSGATATAVGGHSVGQYLMGKLMETASGSTGSSQTINPIIAFKDIGNNAIDVAEILYVNGKYQKNKNDEPGMISKAASWVGGLMPGPSMSDLPIVGKNATIRKMISDMAVDGLGLLETAKYLLFAAALAMAFYIPMIPFIQWFGAIIHWFVSVCESFLGSSLWAMAHFDSEGEGMGQRASYGYIYMLNNFARPIIMVFAFFLASATVTVVGTFLFRYYGASVASAAGNSTVGLLSIIVYLLILAMMGISLINGAFSITLGLADSIIGFLGGASVKSAFSHDVEKRVDALFVNAAGSGSKMVKVPAALARG